MTHPARRRMRTAPAMATIAVVLLATLSAVGVPSPVAAAEPTASTTTISPARDLFVHDSSANANRTFLTERLIIGASRKALLAFPLAQVPNGSVITNARLELYKVHGTDGDIAARAVSSPWSTNVTFQTLPELGAQIAVTKVPYSQNQWFSWDLRAAVTDAVNAGEIEFDLFMDRIDGTGGTEYASSRNANADVRPRLVVETMQIQDMLAADAADLAGLFPAPVFENVTLPAEGTRGSSIAWVSSQPGVIAADGTISRPAIATDATVSLVATLSYKGETRTQEVEVTVRGTYDVVVSHPQVHVNDQSREHLEGLLAAEPWADESLDNLKATLEPHVARHQSDPNWILSRMSMFWEEGKRYTQTYVAPGQVFDRGEGNAPVPTVRMAAMRKWNTNNNAPLEDRLPYSDGSMRNTDGQIVPFMETGHMVRGNNVEILKMAETAGFIYYATGDERYAKFGADILTQWLAGTYYMQPPLDPTRALQGPGGYEPGGISGYYDYEVIHDETGGIAAPAYDFLYDYMVDHPGPAIVGTGKSLTDVAGTVFKRFIDIAMVRGNKTGNWNVFTWLNTVPIILALESDDYYSNGEGREHYLSTYTTTSTAYREALPDMLKVYDANTGMWPESTGYAFSTIENLLELAGPIYTNGIDTIASNTIMKKSALATLQWLDARGNIVINGDGRGGPPSYTPLERMNWYFQSVGDDENAEAVSAAIQKAVDAGYYDRSKMGYRGLLYSAGLKPTDGSQASSEARTLYSPFHRTAVQRNGSNPDNALMAAVMGGYPQQNHLNARGLAAQIWSKGWAVGPTNSAYESYWTDDYSYARGPAGSNTVVPGYAHGEITLNGLDPAVPNDRLTNATETSPSHSFSDVTAQGHRRQLAIVRTSPDSGYYVDVFRADQSTSDYLWHNLGTDLELSDGEGQPLSTSPSGALGAPISSYNFFKTTEAVAYDGNFKATWTVPRGVSGQQDLKTDMWALGRSGRTIFTTDAPPTTRNGNVTPNAVNSHIDGESTPTVIIRQSNNNAAQNPFASVFESYGEGEQTVSSVTDFGSGAAFVGLKVASDSLNGREDRVLSASDDALHTPAPGVSFRGLYGVASVDDGGLLSLYLGKGTEIAADGYSIVASTQTAAALERGDGEFTYTSASAVVLTLPVAAADDAGVWVEAQTSEGWTKVTSTRKGDSVEASVPAGDAIPIRVVVDDEGPTVSIEITEGVATVATTDESGLRSLAAVLLDGSGSPVAEFETVEVEGKDVSRSFTLPVGLSYGVYEFRATATDSYGNTRSASATYEIALHDAARAKPAQATLSSDEGWDNGLSDGRFTLSMNLWWGENGSLYRLFENGVLLATVPLTYAGTGAQSAVFRIDKRPNGSYRYTGELVNSRGTTRTTEITVEVKQAAPGLPSLSHNNWDGDGDFSITADLWWGTNATSYQMYEDGVLIGEGPMDARTPSAQRAVVAVKNAHAGSHVYEVVFHNHAGSTRSAPLTVSVGESATG